MFSRFSQSELSQLIEVSEGPCVSLYIPTHRSGHERQQDDIRLKNLLRDAERQLDDKGISRAKRDELLAPLSNLPNDLDIWLHRSGSVAAFAADGFFRCYTFSMNCPELVVIGERFQVSPMLPLLHANRHYFLLTLTKNSANLYEATRQSLAEMELPAFEPVQVDGDERLMQQHSHRAPSQGHGKTGETIHHGQGGPDEREKSDIANFYKRQVEPAVTGLLKGQPAPLVLACVDYLAAIYREANSYPHLAAVQVSGSPSEFDEVSLRDRGWQVAAPLLRSMERRAVEEYHKLAGSNRTSVQMEPIAEAARTGRVGTLFVQSDMLIRQRVSGRIDGEQERTPLTVALNDVVAQTRLHSGRVLGLDEALGEAPVAAIFRY